VFKIEEKIFGEKSSVLKNISKQQEKILPNSKSSKKHVVKNAEIWYAS